MIYLITFPIWSIPVMLIWYAIGIQVNRGGVYKPLMPVAFTGFLFDVFLQYTVANIWFWEIPPKKRVDVDFPIAISLTTGGFTFSRSWRIKYSYTAFQDFTISMRCGRLLSDKGWRGRVAHYLAVVLNFLAPDHNHIPGAV